ncbi:MAG: alkaline phosphatase family protein [Nitrososphaerales archaeon]
MGRVLLLGLDGSSLNIIQPLIEKFNLKNLKQVIVGGLSGPLESVIPYVTPPGWASVFSGVNPGKHGCFDIFNFNGLGTHVTNMRESKVQFLWDYLSKAGFKVVVLGMPFTHPAAEVNGVFVTGYPAPISAYPKELKSRMKREGYTTDIPKMGDENGLSRERWVEKVVTLASARAEISLKIMDEEKWDAFILIENITDMTQHLVMEDQELLGKVYAEIDSLVGRLLGRMMDDDIMMITSDHGGRSSTRSFVLNQWLWENGYLTPKESIMKGLFKRASNGLDEFLGNRAVKRSLSGTVRSLTKPLVSFLAPFIVSSLFDKSTKAFSIGTNESVAWVKLLPDDEVEKERVKQEIKNGLKMLKTEDGNPVFKSVTEPSEVYHGPRVEDAPGDIIVESDGGLLITNWGASDKGFFTSPPPAREGIHSPTGVFIAYGKTVSPGKVSAHVCDITPTILHTLGIPIPSGLDGKVIKI